MTEVLQEIRLEASEAVAAGLEALGRTEDIAFAPGGDRLAIACYRRNEIAVLDLEVDARSVDVASIRLAGSKLVHNPHGVAFVDDDTIAVASRGGHLGAFRLPTSAAGELEPVALAGDASGLLDSPGSVVVRTLEPGRHEVLACNNWVNTVTRHPLVADGSRDEGEIVAHKWLDLPDGLALSGDAEWLAVSNHNRHNVLVYRYADTGDGAGPAAILRGIAYPHGVQFAHDDRLLLVADAGAPYVHVYATEDGWKGVHLPASTIRVMDEATFERGRNNPQEGGPKGLAVDPTSTVFAVTSEEQPLAFFELDGVAALGHPPGFDDELVRYELLVQAEADEARERAEADAERVRAMLSEIVNTRAWRLTAPLRRLRAVLRRPST